MIRNPYGAHLIGGLRVFFSELCLEDTKEPARVHVERRWMRGTAYHARIQKKWLKRFGTELRPCMYIANGNTLWAHPSLAGLLEEVLNSEARRVLKPAREWV